MSPPRAWLVAGIVLASAMTAAADVRWEHERVTARFGAVPLVDAIQALADATGGELQGAVAEPRDLTIELDAVTLEEALHRMLGPQNFTVRYGEGGRVKTIVLRGGPEAPAPKPQTSPAAGVQAAHDPQKPTFPIVLSRMFNRHRAIKLSEPLVERFGEEKATMPRLLEIATGDDDGTSRALASQAVLSALEKEARYRRSFLRSLHDLSPDDMATIAQGPSGERLEELLTYLSVHSREPTLQKKAGIVLDQVHEARAGES